MILLRTSGHSAKRAISKTVVKYENQKEVTTALTVHNNSTAKTKEQALARAGRDGILGISKDLGLTEVTLYAWRILRRRTGHIFAKQNSTKTN